MISNDVGDSLINVLNVFGSKYYRHKKVMYNADLIIALPLKVGHSFAHGWNQI